MTIDPKKADSYLRELLQKFDKDRNSLDPHTRRLIIKYREAQSKGDRLNHELEQLRNQIQQAEARFRSMELQTADAMGKASGLLEVLVSMKFEDEPAVPLTPSQENQKSTSDVERLTSKLKKKLQAGKNDARPTP